MHQIRVAIVGCGRISDLHAMGYKNRRDARIVAVCDFNRKRVHEKAKEWHVEKAYTAFKQVLDDQEIDLVELLVPHDLHAPMTVATCYAGKHDSVQKPMALTVAEADQMIDTADQNKVILRVFENYIFYPPYVQAKKMIEAGEIGEPRMIRLHVNTGSPGWHVPLRV